MHRIALALTLVTVCLAPLAHAAEPVRHTGSIVAVTPDQRGFTLEEMGPWTGPSQGLVTRPVVLTPDTTVVGVTRAKSGGEWAGGFTESPLAVGDLRRGDWVTVVGELQGGRLVARSVIVARPTAGTE